MSFIYSDKTKIIFKSFNDCVQSVEINFVGLDDTERFDLHKLVCLLYGTFQCIYCHKKIHCPYFGSNNFILSYRSGPENVVEILEACGNCIKNYDKILGKHLSNINKKVKILKNIFGDDITNVICDYSWSLKRI